VKQNSQNQLQSIEDKINEFGHQFELFCGFLAMVNGSPTVTESIDKLIVLFQTLKEPDWYSLKTPEGLRSLFVNQVLGDYLKCFHCKNCGAKVIVNKPPYKKGFGYGYKCPSCHLGSYIVADDSFLKAMASKQQLEDTESLIKVKKEYDTLLPFKAFLNAPCEVCHKPVGEWDAFNVKLAIQGAGCGHTSCWNSELGKMRQTLITIQKFKKDSK
jgi:predicted RNA-binding Zn-ribbon protein involved in translation (DUF1610 family)